MPITDDELAAAKEELAKAFPEAGKYLSIEAFVDGWSYGNEHICMFYKAVINGRQYGDVVRVFPDARSAALKLRFTYEMIEAD